MPQKLRKRSTLGFGDLLALVALLLVIVPSMASAYIDPGTGAYAIQVFVAMFGALIFFATHPVRFLRDLFRGIRDRLRSKST